MASTRNSWKTARPAAARAFWRMVTGRSPERATATKLYGSIVTQARTPRLYERSRVPDDPTGRLEMLMLHMALVLWRLRREGAAGFALARALNEAFVADMDDCMREMGVGDLTVPRKVKKAAAALYDRTRTLNEIFDGGDEAALADAVGAGVLQGADGPGIRWLACYLRESRDELGRQSGADLRDGTVRFAQAEH